MSVSVCVCVITQGLICDQILFMAFNRCKQASAKSACLLRLLLLKSEVEQKKKKN